MIDHGPSFNFVRNLETHLYDFQEAAVSHCVKRLQRTTPPRVVLALDTGLGKTCAIRAIIDKLNCRALVIVPGGLVRQIAQGLSRYPWESIASKVVIPIETGRELVSALSTPEVSHQILVVNRALRFNGTEMLHYQVLIVDEAHQQQSLFVARKLGEPRVPTLFVTATPECSWQLQKLVLGQFLWDHSVEWERCVFSVRKSLRVINLLGIAKPHPVIFDLDLEDMRSYDDCVVKCLSRYSTGSTNFELMRGIRMSLAVVSALPRLRNSCVLIVREALRRVNQNNVPFDLLTKVFEFLNEEEPPGLNQRKYEVKSLPAVCPCCSLTSEDRGIFARLHASITYEPPPVWTHFKLKTLTSVIVRFPNKKALEWSLSVYPIPSHVNCFVLTSDKSAAYRANLVKRFAGKDGQKTKLTVIHRAIENGTASELFLKVASLQFFMSYLTESLSAPRLLLADATVDVGFDLHRHADGVYVPRLPHNRSELHQVIGRVCRIAPERPEQGVMNVISHKYRESLDELLWSHLIKGDDS